MNYTLVCIIKVRNTSINNDKRLAISDRHSANTIKNVLNTSPLVIHYSITTLCISAGRCLTLPEDCHRLGTLSIGTFTDESRVNHISHSELCYMIYGTTQRCLTLPEDCHRFGTLSIGTFIDESRVNHISDSELCFMLYGTTQRCLTLPEDCHRLGTLSIGTFTDESRVHHISHPELCYMLHGTARGDSDRHGTMSIGTFTDESRVHHISHPELCYMLHGTAQGQDSDRHGTMSIGTFTDESRVNHISHSELCYMLYGTTQRCLTLPEDCHRLALATLDGKGRKQIKQLNRICYSDRVVPQSTPSPSGPYLAEAHKLVNLVLPTYT
ncbi:hypothetical protein J6590_007682 [Homalodisca vitripennis]|nr:hypothetical protein J6590_007682 [Homalodisca vitripennis]